MPVAPSIGSSFPIARCDRCGRKVLTCMAIDENGAEYRACAHCDTPIASEIFWERARARGSRVRNRREGEAGRMRLRGGWLRREPPLETGRRRYFIESIPSV